MVFILLVALIPILLGIDLPQAEAADGSRYAAAHVIDHLAEGREDAALRLYAASFVPSDYEFLRPEVLAVARVISFRDIVQNPLFRSLGPLQLEFFKLMLINGPLTAQLEREVLFLAANTGTVEGMALLYTHILDGTEGVYVNLPNLPSMFSPFQEWRFTRFYFGKQLLHKSTLVSEAEVHGVILKWAEIRFGEDPNPLVATVDGRTPENVRQMIAYLIHAIPNWKNNLRGVALNKYRFFIAGCEGHLI